MRSLVDDIMTNMADTSNLLNLQILKLNRQQPYVPNLIRPSVRHLSHLRPISSSVNILLAILLISGPFLTLHRREMPTYKNFQIIQLQNSFINKYSLLYFDIL